MTVTAPDFRSHVEHNLDALRGTPGREAFVHEGRRVTAGEFHDLVHAMAWAMRNQNISRGDTVTLLSGNLPEAVAARYAANLLGCKVNHLYNKLAADVQATLMRDVETRALVVDPRYVQRAEAVLALAPVEHVLVLGPGKHSGVDLLELAARQPGDPYPGEARPDDICSIRHTGGTTGHPKGICSTYQSMADMRSATADTLGDAPRQLICTTLAHAAGSLADNVLAAGGTLVLQEDFNAAEVLAAIERERITHMFLLPPLLYQLMDEPASARTDTSSLRRLVYGGCQASPARLADAVRRFGPVLMQGYGQNEAGGISVLTPEDHERPELLRTAGKALDGVEVEIRDESGRPVENGALGEVCVRSAQVMEGYWKQPALTAEVLRAGWAHTGDLGYLDSEGYLTVVDRIKDMIVVVGGHVYTTELEDLLNSHPQVRQSAVYGVRDADRMERVHAAVVLAPGGDVTGDALREMVRRERGAMYEPAHITFLDRLPLTDAGKPDKKQLRSAAA